MGGSGKGGGGSSSSEVRYAPYIESRHNNFLGLVAYFRDLLDWASPYAAYTNIEVEDAFFGAGYTIASFPSLYDMYGKFMAGLDIEVLWDQEYEDTVNSAEVAKTVSAESALLDDDIEQNVLPRFQTGMRDMNAVMGSSYIVGKSLIESARVKSLAKFDAELRYRMVPVAAQKWQAHLQWNQNVIQTYAEIMKLYYSAKQDIDEVNYSMAARHTLWPFTVLDFERAALGAMQGAATTKTTAGSSSGAGKAISGAMAGGMMGGMMASATTGTAMAVSGPVGIAVGAGLGLLGGILG